MSSNHGGEELDAVLRRPSHEVDRAEAGEAACLDLGDHLATDDLLVGAGVLRGRPSAPYPADHQAVSFREVGVYVAAPGGCGRSMYHSVNSRQQPLASKRITKQLSNTLLAGAPGAGCTCCCRSRWRCHRRWRSFGTWRRRCRAGRGCRRPRARLRRATTDDGVAAAQGLVVWVVAVVDVRGEQRGDPRGVVRLPGLDVRLQPSIDIISLHRITFLIAKVLELWAQASLAHGNHVGQTPTRSSRSATKRSHQARPLPRLLDWGPLPQPLPHRRLCGHELETCASGVEEWRSRCGSRQVTSPVVRRVCPAGRPKRYGCGPRGTSGRHPSLSRRGRPGVAAEASVARPIRAPPQPSAHR